MLQRHIKKLNSVHRKAIKHLVYEPTLSTEGKFKILKLLPLDLHFKFNKTLLIHKIYHERTPSYLEHLIDKATDRYNSKGLIPPLPRIDLYKTSVSYSGSKLWNSLPLELKSVTSQNVFKKKLFLHYYDMEPG